jgi:hypothetical protein
VDASYVFNLYQLLGTEETRTSQWVRLSAYGPFAGQAFLRGDFEYALGDDLRGTRALVEAGYRF